MNILAIDAATVTGWASEIDRRRESGFKDFTPLPGEGPGWRYIRFNVWLYTWKEKPLELVVVEKTIPNMTRAITSEIAFGLSTRVTEFCARQRVRLIGIHNATLKKYFTGDGRAEKHEMIRAAQTIDPKVEDDNEADAILLLQFAKLVILKGKKR
jgi:crossover junction endodeoxyribonuclease RuvC